MQCHYFDDVINGIDSNFGDILLGKKIYENISVYGISYKTLIDPKQLHISFDKIDGFIRVCGGEFRHLVLFYYGLFEKICDKIKYLIREKCGITDSINHNFGEIRIDSYSSLPTEKILTLHNVTILVKSVVNKDKNNYYYNIFLEKGLYKDKVDTQDS